MQDIYEYISRLLFIHECVILPGFGGFITNNKSADINTTNHTFTPPQKDILFNSHLTYNDGLLINYLVKNLNISYSEAELKIEDEVQRIWLELDKNKKITFKGIGVFEYNKDNKLLFTPKNTINYDIKSYGLSSFRFPPLDYQKNTLDIVQLNSLSMKNTKKIKWVAAAIVILAIGVSILFPSSENKEQAGYNFIIDNNSTKLANTVIDSDSNMSNAINKNTNKRTALFYSENNELLKKQKNEGYKFYIIGGSFKNKTNAKQYIQQHKNKEFNMEILNIDNLYRVSLKCFDNKVKALHELRRIRNNEQNDKVWLLSYK